MFRETKGPGIICFLTGLLFLSPAALMAGNNEIPPIAVPEGDSDGDGLINKDEAYYETNPNPSEGWDTDKDGVPDGQDAIPTDPDFRFKRAPVYRYAVIDLGVAGDPDNQDVNTWTDALAVSDNGQVLLRKAYMDSAERDILIWKAGNTTTALHLGEDDGRFPVSINNNSTILYGGGGNLVEKDPSLNSVPADKKSLKTDLWQSPIAMNNHGDIVGWGTKRVTGSTFTSNVTYFHHVVDLFYAGTQLVWIPNYNIFNADHAISLGQDPINYEAIYNYKVTTSSVTAAGTNSYYYDAIYPAIWNGGRPTFLFAPPDRNDLVFTHAWHGNDVPGAWWFFNRGSVISITSLFGIVDDDADDTYNAIVDNTTGWDDFDGNRRSNTTRRLVINDLRVVAGSVTVPTDSGNPNWIESNDATRTERPIVWPELGKPGVILPTKNTTLFTSQPDEPFGAYISDINNGNIILGGDTKDRATFDYGAALWLKVNDIWKRKDMKILYPKNQRQIVSAFQIDDQNEMLMGGWELWRNGEVCQLPDYIDGNKWELWNEVSMSKTGLILAYAHLKSDTSYARHSVLLLPFEIEGYKRGTINSPGAKVSNGSGEYGQETVMMENADSEDNATQPDYATTAVDATNDDDLVKVVLRWRKDMRINGAKLELKHTGMEVDPEQSADAEKYKETGPSRLNFYKPDGTKLTDADLKIDNLGSPGSSYLAEILTTGELTLFVEGAANFGDLGLTASKMKLLGGAMLNFEFNHNGTTSRARLLVYRGGFLVFRQPQGQPGVAGAFEFWDGKGRVKNEHGGYHQEFKVDITEWGTRLESWMAKSGKLVANGASTDYRTGGGKSHTPPGWWWAEENPLDETEQQTHPASKAITNRGRANEKWNQAGFCRWQQDDAAAGQRYTANWVYDKSISHDAQIGQPTSIEFKFRLFAIPPTTPYKRSGLLIHPDGKRDGTLGCIGLQTWEGVNDAVNVLRRYHGLKLKVQNN